MHPLLLLPLALAATSYLIVVQRRRFVLARSVSSFGYDHLSRDELYKKLTLSDAETINQNLGQLEFPLMWKTALQFALFRVRRLFSVSFSPH